MGGYGSGGRGSTCREGGRVWVDDRSPRPTYHTLPTKNPEPGGETGQLPSHAACRRAGLCTAAARAARPDAKKRPRMIATLTVTILVVELATCILYLAPLSASMRRTLVKTVEQSGVTATLSPYVKFFPAVAASASSSRAISHSRRSMWTTRSCRPPSS